MPDFVPLDRKLLLTLKEASAYTGIGVNKLRELSDGDQCGFVLYVGSKRLLKREALEAFLNDAYSI